MRNRMNEAMCWHFIFSILNCPLMKAYLLLRDTRINWLFYPVRFWQSVYIKISLYEASVATCMDM